MAACTIPLNLHPGFGPAMHACMGSSYQKTRLRMKLRPQHWEWAKREQAAP